MDGILGGGLGQFPLEQWFFEMPVCTRIWTSAAVMTSVLCQCKIITPFQLFYSVRAVFLKNQYWRLFTTFFYFGDLSLDLLLHVFFLQRYSRLLEEGSGPSPAQYSWLLAYATVFLLFIAPFFSIPFLGQALSGTLTYIWSRRNPDTLLNFLGFVTFGAPFLPWVLVLFSVVMHGHVPKDELCGIVVGHIWYFFTDVWPPTHNGQRPLDPPMWWRRLFDGPPVTHIAPPDETGQDTPDATRDILPTEPNARQAPAPEIL